MGIPTEQRAPREQAQSPVPDASAMTSSGTPNLAALPHSDASETGETFPKILPQLDPHVDSAKLSRASTLASANTSAAPAATAMALVQAEMQRIDKMLGKIGERHPGVAADVQAKALAAGAKDTAAASEVSERRSDAGSLVHGQLAEAIALRQRLEAENKELDAKAERLVSAFGQTSAQVVGDAERAKAAPRRRGKK